MSNGESCVKFRAALCEARRIVGRGIKHTRNVLSYKRSAACFADSIQIARQRLKTNTETASASTISSRTIVEMRMRARRRLARTR